tara:strand:- start:136 stop:876 length:741 start_codon:yes stop_codon:yes gene_type:complete
MNPPLIVLIAFTLISCSGSKDSKSNSPSDGDRADKPDQIRRMQGMINKEYINQSPTALATIFNGMLEEIPDTQPIDFKVEVSNGLHRTESLIGNTDPCLSGYFVFTQHLNSIHNKLVSLDNQYTLDITQVLSGNMADYNFELPENCQLEDREFEFIQNRVQTYLEDIPKVKDKSQTINELFNHHGNLNLKLTFEYSTDVGYHAIQKYYHHNNPKQLQIRLYLSIDTSRSRTRNTYQTHINDDDSTH